MDLLSWGILGGIVVAGVSGLNLIRINMSRRIGTWHKLGLSKYKIRKHYKEKDKEVFIVEVPIGGSYNELSSYKDKIEKAYGCECNIVDCEKSRYIRLNLFFQ